VPTYADHDAEQVAHGILLSGKANILDAAVSTASKPLSVSDLERTTRPGIAPRRKKDGDDFEYVGMLKIAAGERDYAIAAQWFGWLPGPYATRDAALAAYGYILGGETHGYLDALRNQVVRGEGRPITLEDLNAFATD